MSDCLRELHDELSLVGRVQSLEGLEQIRLKWLGKQGLLTQELKALGRLDPDQRKQHAASLNQAKDALKDALSARREALSAELEAAALAQERCDITLPGNPDGIGRLHPVTQVMQRLSAIMTDMGFDLTDGPEMEDDFHNFTALNIPETHPARASHDTFYLQGGGLLRTHTSPVQIRTMLEVEPPLRVAALGRVYRCDSDQTHTPVFHQMEGLVVDEQATFADLKAFLQAFLSTFFEKDVVCRYRPSYFPFTEPSCEVDIQCFACSGQGCRVCSQTGWVEVLGCGMVHPHVFKASKVDASRWQGYAFGIGVERLVMFHYGLDDIRKLYENDLRFLQQF